MTTDELREIAQAAARQPYINILVVKTNASFISTEARSWEAAVAAVIGWADSSLHKGLINDASPVFFKNLNDPHCLLEQTTIGQVRADRAAGIV